MRLTLRTLLAYLDDILDPSDKEELGKKIESSEFAEELVHRTKDTMRRLRLSAPQVVGTGMGLDPNSVAEYLDNVMSPDSVGDFERICLESDVHLAEVASCHHVLTMVLGEPADVDLAAKQRMYGIPAELEERKRMRVEVAHVAAHAPLPKAEPIGLRPVSPLGAIDQSRVVEIPDYLRTSGWSRYRGALLGFAALLLLAATVYLLGGVTDWFGGSDGMGVALNDPLPSNASSDAPLGPKSIAPGAVDSAAGNLPVSEPPTESVSPPPTAVTSLPDVRGDGDRYSTPPPLSSPPPPLTPGVLTPGITPHAAAPAAATEPDRYAITTPEAAGTDPASPAGSEVPPALNSQTGEDPSDTSRSAPSPYDVPPTTGTLVVTSPEMPAVGATTPPKDTNPPADTVAVATPPQDAAMITGSAGEGEEAKTASNAPPTVTELPPEKAEPEVKKPLDMGTYLGGKTVLLRRDAAGDGWYRVSPRESVTEGEKLVSLPEFRPSISLTSSVNLDMSGGTMIEISTDEAVAGTDETAAEGSHPAIDVVYGRMVLLNTGSTDNTVQLTFGPTKADVRLSPKATLGVEVERTYVPGHDPRKSPTPVVVRLYAPDGTVEWRDSAGSQRIDKPSEWTIRDGVVSTVTESTTPPEWIDQEPIGTLSEQRYGAPVVESSLTTDRPAELQLLELFKGGQRKEVKSLVARSAGNVGLFEPSIDALGDPNQRWPSWEMHVAAIRAAMAQSPESAQKVWEMLVKQRGETAAADLYEMLCGYSPDQVGGTADEWRIGSLARLVDWMGDDNLDYRVLAVYNLQEITGKRPIDPSDRLKERQQAVKRFKTRLESGDLRPKE